MAAPHLDIGIGLNTGVASVGNMGSALRYGYTALGDTVNLSSRLEGLNKDYGTHILVNETTYMAAKDDGFLFRELHLIRVKGKLQPVAIYELIGRAAETRFTAPRTKCATGSISSNGPISSTGNADGRTPRNLSKPLSTGGPKTARPAPIGSAARNISSMSLLPAGMASSP